MMASDKRRDTPAYWEARLQRMGLGMESAHVDWITYGFSVNERDQLDKHTVNAYHAGEKAQRDEWTSR
jgi:hypothetical protein